MLRLKELEISSFSKSNYQITQICGPKEKKKKSLVTAVTIPFCCSKKKKKNLVIDTFGVLRKNRELLDLEVPLLGLDAKLGQKYM